MWGTSQVRLGARALAPMTLPRSFEIEIIPQVICKKSVELSLVSLFVLFYFDLLTRQEHIKPLFKQVLRKKSKQKLLGFPTLILLSFKDVTNILSVPNFYLKLQLNIFHLL